jgi:hypothetical protein
VTDYSRDYSRCLRYAAGESPWQLMQKRLHAEPHLKWGTHPEAAEFRPIAADAYQDETGDEHGAELLRQPSQHVLIDGDGRVRKGRFTTDHVIAAASAAGDYIRDLRGGYYAEHPFDNVHLHSDDPHLFRDEDFEEPPGPLPPHHERLIHTDPDGHAPHLHTDVHISELGDSLAHHLEAETDYAPWDEMEDGDLRYGHEQRLRELIDQVRKAPVEEADDSDPSSGR